MKSDDTFKQLYNKLNSEQRTAVDAIEGPVMVIAGPGTGKTHMLTLRIANILRLTDTSPESILALTFTESAVSAMRSRLIEVVGSAAYRVNIHTFHGFCNRIIERHPDAFPRIIGSRHAGDIDQIRILEDLIDAERLRFLKPYGNKYHYVIEIIGAIRELKREAITPANFAKQVAMERRQFENIPDRYYTSGRYAGRLKGKYATVSSQLAKLSELLMLYRKYEKELRTRGLYDYEDMIMETLAVLEKNRDLLLRLQERYQYILADEHQDANSGQNKLLALLASFHANPNLFVVGDEKQAIFRFQGASLQNFLSFTSNYPEASVVRLVENYRSRQYILDAATSLMRHGFVPDDMLRVELRSARDGVKGKTKSSEATVRVLELSERSLEHWMVAIDIRDAIEAGEDAHEIAILYRDNRDRLPFVQALELLQVPYSVFSDDSILDDSEIEKLVVLLRAVNAPHKAEYVSRALFIDFLGVDPFDAFMIFDALSGTARRKNNSGGVSRMSLNKLLRSRAELEKLGLQDPALVVNCYKNILSWSAFAKNRGLMESLEIIAKESGFLTHLLSRDDGHEIMRKFDRLITEFSRAIIGERSYSLRDALRHIDTLDFYKVALKAPSDQTTSSIGVRLMTAHRSKGLEFDRVYIVGALNGHWGNRRRPRALSKVSLVGSATGELQDSETDLDIADERRLFYVALTRARHSMNITYHAQDDSGSRLLPSQFIEEIDSSHIHRVSTTDMEPDLYDVRNNLRATASLLGGGAFVGLEKRDYLRSLFDARGFSVSALNNYLKCPWRYFFENLIRLPHAPNRHQLYGIAVHAGLKDLFDDLQFGRRALKRRLLEGFERSLKRQALSERDFNETLEKGRIALAGYFDTYIKPDVENKSMTLETEFAIRGVFLEAEQEGEPFTVRLTGVLDKININNEPGEDKNSVVVIDYKTGKARSRNYIEGKTKDSSGDYKRQLVFYKVLLDNFAGWKYTMNSGEIDFVEPDERGRYRREKFEITDNDCAELTTLIISTAVEIRSLGFWDRKCEDRKCEHCALRNMMSV